MLVLSIDSAASSCGVCVWHDGRVIAEAEERMERGQDARLLPLIIETIKRANTAFKDFDRIAVTRGPGSFTGLRIGLAAARGIGFASDKPVIGIDRFSIYRTQSDTPRKNLLVVIESKRKELFVRFYPASSTAHEPQMLTQDEIIAFLKTHPDTVTAGDTAAREGNEAAICAALAAKADINDTEFLPRPLYIRPPDVTMSKKSA